MFEKTHLLRFFGVVSLFIITQACSSAGEWEMSNIRNAHQKKQQSQFASQTGLLTSGNNVIPQISSGGNGTSSTQEEDGENSKEIIIEDEDGNLLKYSSRFDCPEDDEKCTKIITVIFQD